MLIPVGPSPAPQPRTTPPIGGTVTPPPAPAATPTSSVPSGGYGGGSSQSFYTSDPGYLAALMAQTTGDAQIRQLLNTEIARAIVGYGDPSLAKQAGFDLGSQAAAEARQNYLAGNSTLAQLDKSHTLALQNIVNQLAGRGILFSGENGYQHGQEDQAYGNNVYNAQQAVLNAILGYRQTAMQQEQGLQSQVVSSLENAYNNYLNSGLYGGAPSGNVTPASSTPSYDNPSAYAGQTVRSGQASAAVSRQLLNPYTTGQKRLG